MTLGGELLQIGLNPLGAGAWHVPEHVETDGEILQWERGHFSEATAGSDLVDLFVNLSTADIDAVARFAAQFGPLFRLPDDRGHHYCRACDVATGRGAILQGEFVEHGSEPVAAWRRLAGDCRAMLQVAAAYHKDDHVSEETLALFRNAKVERIGAGLDPDFVNALLPSSIESLADGTAPGELNEYSEPTAEVIGTYVNLLLDRVRIRSYMSPDGLPTVRIEPFSLLGALGIQLMQKMSTTAGLAVCSGCGASFNPSRKPRAGSRTYCSACRAKKVPQRDAARASRTRAGQRSP